MFGYAVVVGLAAMLFWLDPILQIVAPSLVTAPATPATPVLRRTPRPAINTALLALEDDGDDDGAGETCPEAGYTTHVLSKAPLVLYLENFLSLEERQHLVDISGPLYEPSTITHDGGSSVQRNAAVRDSEVAVVPRTATVRCIEARARALQGWRDDLWIERLRVQRYRAPAGHYGYHYDWSRSGAATGGWGRASSLMVFVDDGTLDGSGGQSDNGRPVVPLRGGGTAFPRLRRPSADRRWCRFIWCAGDTAKAGTDNGDAYTDAAALDDPDFEAAARDNTTGVVFKPVPGHAVFWENFRPDSTGRAFEETWHAGLRVAQGIKVGLNIWSWGRLD